MIRKTLFALCFCMVTARAYGQASLSYYPFSSIVGISSNPDKIAWADLRIQTNTFLSNTNMEFCPMLNFKRDSVKKCYVGAGVNFNVIYGLVNDRYINGYSVTVGSRISPFHKVRNLSFIIELSPYINAEFSGATLRTNLGIGWHFRHRTRT